MKTITITEAKDQIEALVNDAILQTFIIWDLSKR